MNFKIDKALGIALDILKIGSTVAPPALEIINTVRSATKAGRDLTDGELDKAEAYRKEAEKGWAEQANRYGVE